MGQEMDETRQTKLISENFFSHRRCYDTGSSRNFMVSRIIIFQINISHFSSFERYGGRRYSTKCIHHQTHHQTDVFQGAISRVRPQVHLPSNRLLVYRSNTPPPPPQSSPFDGRLVEQTELEFTPTAASRSLETTPSQDVSVNEEVHTLYKYYFHIIVFVFLDVLLAIFLNQEILIFHCNRSHNALNVV